MNEAKHLPVMPSEIIELLKPTSGGLYVDGTAGGGGHSELILQASGPDGRLIAIDRDQRALDRVAIRLKQFESRLTLLHQDFRSFSLQDEETKADGILLDLGVSSFQLDDPEAGFSFRFDGPLDMRMDRSQPTTAADMVNTLSLNELTQIIREYGEEKFARKVARAIISQRELEKFSTTTQLADVVRAAVPHPRGPERIDRATRTFQALRIAVNDELRNLNLCLENLASSLNSGGRLAVISFHSLEDRIAKRTFRKLSGDVPDKSPAGMPSLPSTQEPEFRQVSRKLILASDDEQRENPRSRSAKLRVLERK
jgi:16S rRNA (cytosine1402-N4)-methyltransferase